MTRRAELIEAEKAVDHALENLTRLIEYRASGIAIALATNHLNEMCDEMNALRPVKL